MYYLKSNTRPAPAQKQPRTCAPSNGKSILLRLPADIRVMIYREICALPSNLDSDCDDDSSSSSDSNPDSGSDSGSDSEGVNLQNQHLEMITAIQNLAITCRRIREELTDVYFLGILPRTQFHFGIVYPPHSVRTYNRYRGPTERPLRLSPQCLPTYAMFEVLQSSSLFT